MEWGWVAVFWPEMGEEQPRVHAAELPILAEKVVACAKADKSWEKFVDVKRLTYYHRDTDTYDVEFTDGGEAFSVPRHLIASAREASAAKEKYEKRKKDQSDNKESGSDQEDTSDDEGSGDNQEGDGRGGGGGGGGDRSASKDFRKKQDKADKEARAKKDEEEALERELTDLLAQVGSNTPYLAVI